MKREDPNDRTVIERADPLVGTVLDRRFLIEFRIAAGGFGAIYRAKHVSSGHPFALKVMHARLARDRGVVARFKREGATLTTLRCPHTITAYELGEAPDGTLYIVMELLEGDNVFERFQAEGPFEWRQMVRIARAVCSSLAEAHALGIVHRDLKPTNIHLENREGDRDYVKVLDFGIAKILQDSQFDATDLTSVGQMIGTIDYMSPEQMVGGAVTGSSDIYTLGIMMYEMIAGRRPFPDATSASSALAAVMKTPPALSSLAIIPAELDRVVMRCLQREPDKRFATVDELGTALERLLGPTEEASATRPLERSIDDDATLITPKPVLAGVHSAVTAPLPVLRPRPPATSATPPPVRSATAVASPPPPVEPSPETTLRGVGTPRLHPPTRPPVFDPTIPDARPDRAITALGRAADREARFRRIVWVLVLTAAAAVGVALATSV